MSRRRCAARAWRVGRGRNRRARPRWPDCPGCLGLPALPLARAAWLSSTPLGVRRCSIRLPAFRAREDGQACFGRSRGPERDLLDATPATRADAMHIQHTKLHARRGRIEGGGRGSFRHAGQAHRARRRDPLFRPEPKHAGQSAARTWRMVGLSWPTAACAGGGFHTCRRRFRLPKGNMTRPG